MTPKISIIPYKPELRAERVIETLPKTTLNGVHQSPTGVRELGLEVTMVTGGPCPGM